MRTKATRTAIGAIVFAAVIFTVGPDVLSQACVENTSAFAEDFSSASHIDETENSVQLCFRDQTNPREIITLNRVGANFDLTSPNYVPAWINSLTTNDFDLDGWPDYIGTSSSYSNVLALIRNLGGSGQVGTFQVSLWIDGSTGDAAGWPTRGVGGAAIDGEGHSGITSGDYDGDGDYDFLLVVSTTAGSCSIKRIWLYENTLILNGIRGSTVGFHRTDLTSAWSAQIKGIAWSATMIVSIKFDGDPDVDIILGNKEGDILKLTNTRIGRVDAGTFVIEPTPLVVTGWGGRGVSAIAVANFDGMAGLDIIAGSVTSADIRFYQNDGNGIFTLTATYVDESGDLNNNMYDGGATVALSEDFDRDGDYDLVIGTDNWNYGGDGYGGKCYYLRNGGNADFTSKLVFNGPAKTPIVYDFDLGAVFDYDNDGDLDFMIADGNHSQYYYLFKNILADVFNTQGIGYSVNLTPELTGRPYAITRVRLTALDQRILGSSAEGLSVEIWFSNNDGLNWEYYTQYDGSAIANVTNLPWRDFHYFGISLRWKIILTAPPDTMVDFDNASFETPVVDTLRLEYIYVERREYSRSSAAVSAEVGGRPRELLISASFIFPGWEGQLRAYDVTNIPLVGGGGTAIQTITTADPFNPDGRFVVSGGSILWDGGRLLRDRSPSSRTIYAGYRASSGAPLQRIDFTTANVGILAPLIQDKDSDHAGLIQFIRGEGRDWKIGDILHSSPVIVGPPTGDPVIMGSGYAEFQQARASRTSVIYIGANDGMLHCFETATGTELWGFIPYNLLPKLKNMSQKDSRTGDRYFVGDIYVDGTPAVGDAYINGQWRTVLVCGQGAGKGSSIGGGLNYYFALDVTDPANPQPLWELTHTNMGETWSVPAFGKVMQSTTEQWVLFVGSGYDNDTARTVGNRFYVARLDNGQVIINRSVSNVNTNSTSHPRRYPDSYVAFPGSPTAVDADRNGRTNVVYIGDLDGRLYRMDMTSSSTSNWNLTAIYTDRMNYPIITKPAVYLDPTTGGFPLHVFFGTGGDDKAPADRPYAILALTDDGSTAAVGWYLGDATELALPTEKRQGVLPTGEKAWADPVISDSIVYFSTLKGSIENVNPCLNLLDNIGRIFARFVQPMAGSVAGGTALKTAQGLAREDIQLVSKSRKAVTVGERQKAPGTYKREVYVQEYDSTIERLEQSVGALLRIVSWHEVYKIIR